MSSVDINGRFLTQATTGVQRYAMQMVRAIDRRLAAHKELREHFSFRLLAPRCAADAGLGLECIPTVAVGRLRGQAWEQVELPLHSRGRVVLSLCNTAPLAARSVVTIHDASVFVVPAAYSLRFRLWYRVLIPRLGSRALQILTVSEFSRRELTLRGRIPASKITVIYQGVDHILEQPADHAVFGRVPVRPGDYLLAVGSRSPHKNLGAVLRALSHLNGSRPPLVTVGAINPRVFRDPGETITPDVHPAGYVSDGELRALYENAMCLVYPSLYEGFGLPPLEAMACGCPALVARTASLPEVCGDAALYCDPSDARDIARGIAMMQDQREREELRRKGLAQARRFTWEGAATALLDLLGRVGPP